jgi:hypothetical protein
MLVGFFPLFSAKREIVILALTRPILSLLSAIVRLGWVCVLKCGVGSFF